MELSTWLHIDAHVGSYITQLVSAHLLAKEILFEIVSQELEELFETVSQALLSSVDRDCLSGWGGHVFVV